MLGNGIWRIFRHSHNVDFALGILRIYVVKPGAAQGNQVYAERDERVYCVFVYGVVDKCNHSVISFCHDCSVGIELGFKVFDENAVFVLECIKTHLVIRFCVKKSHFYHEKSLLM